jgi:hypothetical protein
VDELTQAAIIGADAIERIEMSLAGTAKTATAIEVKNGFAMKGSVALDAEGFRGEGLGRGKTGGTNRVGRETG